MYECIQSVCEKCKGLMCLHWGEDPNRLEWSVEQVFFKKFWLVGNVTFFMCAPICCQAGCTSAQFNFLLDFAFDFSYITVKLAAHELRSYSQTDYTSHMSVFSQTLYKTVHDWTKNHRGNLQLGSTWKSFTSGVKIYFILFFMAYLSLSYHCAIGEKDCSLIHHLFWLQ